MPIPSARGDISVGAAFHFCRALQAPSHFALGTLWKDADPDIPILKEAKNRVREAAIVK